MIFPSESVYDGCMTILLSNGSIVAQSGVRPILVSSKEILKEGEMIKVNQSKIPSRAGIIA